MELAFNYLKKNALRISLCIFALVYFISLFIYYFDVEVSENSKAKWIILEDYLRYGASSVFSLISLFVLVYIFQDQKKNIQKQRFEINFYKLLEIHNTNVNKINLSDKYGRDVFILLLYEFREILDAVKKANETYHISNKNDQLIALTYTILYYGSDDDSSKVLKSVKHGHSNEFNCTDLFIVDILSLLRKNKELFHDEYKFNLFEGRQCYLGTYYRHLYHLVNFVDSQDILTQQEKKAYMKILRSQLSSYEQALLTFNSFSRIGQKWQTMDLITKYSLIKNLPKNFINNETEINVKNYFKNIIFEWEE